jgi:transposase
MIVPITTNNENGGANRIVFPGCAGDEIAASVVPVSPHLSLIRRPRRTTNCRHLSRGEHVKESFKQEVSLRRNREEAMQVVHERCAGLDVHKKSIYGCVLWFDEEGKKHQEIRSFGAVTAELLRLADWLSQHRVSHVAMEATGVYWRPVWAVLEGQFELMLVNPHHIKAMPGRKTDVKDCEWLADLLQHGLVRGSFVPPTEIQDLRDLTRYRTELTQAQNRVANRIQKVLEQANIKLSSVASDTLGVSGRLMIEAIIAGEDNPESLADLAKKRLRQRIPELQMALSGRVRPHHRFLLKEHLEEWKALAERIRRVEQEIDRHIAPFEHAVTLWQTIPGIDRVTACSLVAEIGINMGQFPSAQHLASWAGVCPGQNESAGKRMSGKTRDGDRWLRRALCQAAWAASHKKNCYFAGQFKRIAARRGVKRALIAVAHAILIVVHTMLSKGASYHELGGDYLEQIHKDQLQKYLIRRLQRLGLTVSVQPAA